MKKLLMITILVAGIFGAGGMAAESSSCHFHGSKVATEETVINCATERKKY